MPGESTNKRCPKCRETDFTSFSSCRFCGTKYDTVLAAPQKADPGKKIVLLSGLTVLVIGLLFFGCMVVTAVNSTQATAVNNSGSDSTINDSAGSGQQATVDWAAEDLKALSRIKKNDKKRLGLE